MEYGSSAQPYPSSAGPSSSSSTFVQVCDRCRWKKIKCDGQRPCKNCLNVNFPCETRARLAKQATPRSYVQYLESRVRQLEGQKRQEWHPQATTAQALPYGEGSQNVQPSSAATPAARRSGRPGTLVELTSLKQLGTHIVDEDGSTRYMGPSSGVGFAAQILQELIPDAQQGGTAIHRLFNLDDQTRSQHLLQMDELLWSMNPVDLPNRRVTEKVLHYFFTYTERCFPILHKPTFMATVDRLYAMDTIGIDDFAVLAQIWFALGIGYFYVDEMTEEERSQHMIRAIGIGAKCYSTAFHSKQDGLTLLQMYALHGYGLSLLRQRSLAIRASSLANCKALEIGLHHDGTRISGNPLEPSMRKRVFWCVFMLHLHLTSLSGLPRLLHESDITTTVPGDVDDDQLTATELLLTLPGRSRIHRFISMCRLMRILSRCLDVLYSTNKRKHTSAKVEQMNRLCCEHLLDQLDFDFQEVPDDLPDPGTTDPEQIAVLCAYVNEQLLYHYIRWLIHRPGVDLDRKDGMFGLSLQQCTEAADSLLNVAFTYRHMLSKIKLNPAAHPMTILIAGLTPLYRAHLTKKHPHSPYVQVNTLETDHKATLRALYTMKCQVWDKTDEHRITQLQQLIIKVFGNSPTVLQIPSETAPTQTSQAEGGGLTSAVEDVNMDYHEHRLEHIAAHDDLRTFVHEAFSPAAEEMWPDMIAGLHPPPSSS